MATLAIVGDILLDRDIDGEVARIASDAPVPVFAERDCVVRAGGAGLASVLAAAGGTSVSLVTAIGTDEEGEIVRELLTAAGVEIHDVVNHARTPVKVRLRAQRQVLLRLDRSGPAAFGQFPPAAATALRAAGSILVSDYGGGLTDLPPVRAALREAAARRPIVWDPHPRGGPPVPGTRVVTPNEAELCQLVGRKQPDHEDPQRLRHLTDAATDALRCWPAGALAATLGGDGALLVHGHTAPMIIPAPTVADGDTCGAGDQFAVSLSRALAAGAMLPEAVRDAVREAADFVAGGGVNAIGAGSVAPDPSTTALSRCGGEHRALEVIERVRTRGGTVVATGGCFDLLHVGHLATLEAARALGDCLIVCLNSDASVRRLKGDDRPLVTEADRAALLAGLRCVDAVVTFDEATPTALLRRLRPDLWVKGGDYFLNDGTGSATVPEAAAVADWGGQHVVLPYQPGRSTTNMIESGGAVLAQALWRRRSNDD
jgi:rfaE bifunctional protein nucleotidyltransferase chain/domain/rfaE bifunctional protein kinase chain/domain